MCRFVEAQVQRIQSLAIPCAGGFVERLSDKTFLTSPGMRSGPAECCQYPQSFTFRQCSSRFSVKENSTTIHWLWDEIVGKKFKCSFGQVCSGPVSIHSASRTSSLSF